MQMLLMQTQETVSLVHKKRAASGVWQPQLSVRAVHLGAQVRHLPGHSNKAFKDMNYEL